MLTCQELEKALLEYLGTVSPKTDHPIRQDAPCEVNRPDPKLQHQVWHLEDSDERATAYISGDTPPPSLLQSTIICPASVRPGTGRHLSSIALTESNDFPHFRFNVLSPSPPLPLALALSFHTFYYAWS